MNGQLQRIADFIRRKTGRQGLDDAPWWRAIAAAALDNGNTADAAHALRAADDIDTTGHISDATRSYFLRSFLDDPTLSDKERANVNKWLGELEGPDR